MMLVAALLLTLALSATAQQQQYVVGGNEPCGCSAAASAGASTLPSYRVSLDNCGPRPSRLPAKSSPGITTAPVVKPPVVLPYTVPRPRTVSNVCRCFKTIVKPQVLEQQIIVPVVKKYIQTVARPSMQVIEYCAEPINCPRVETYADEPCAVAAVAPGSTCACASA